VKAVTEYRLPTHDGLKDSWDYPTIFVNPPYGTDKVRKTRIYHWFKRIAEAADNGSQIIVLVPVATNTSHWKEYVYPKAQAICFISAPRLKFYVDGKEDPKGAPMSCALIYYGNDVKKFAQEFKTHGVVIPLENVTLAV
jgi:hypothetical protein